MQSVFPISYDTASFEKLEAIPFEGIDTYVQIVDPEFSSVCPKTGLPDYGTVVLQYVPYERKVELKAYKLYLRSFYGVGIFHEDTTQRIYNDLWNLLVPQYLRLVIVWGARGGLHTTTQVFGGQKAWADWFQDPYQAAQGWRNR